MQRQKTIAKWLAVLLLATLAVACYIVLNAALDSNRPADNVAGADNIEPPQDQTPDPTPPIDDVKPQPVYSQLPREARRVGGATVNHFGGEGNDFLLDSVYCYDKTIFVFKTESQEHDVKGEGLYFAAFDGGELISVDKICDGDEDYIDCTLSAGGLLVLTRSKSATRIRLFDRDLAMTVSKEAPPFLSYKLFTSRGELKMYVTTGGAVMAYTISRTLELAESSNTLALSAATIEEVLPAGANDLIFLQRGNTMIVATFSSKDGFILRNELLNQRFRQLLPTVTDGAQSVAVLTQNDGGMLLTGFTQLGDSFAQYPLDGVHEAALFGDGSNVLLFDGKNAHTFCSHLEHTGMRALTLDGAFGQDFSYAVSDGLNDALLIRSNGVLHVVKRDGQTLKSVFSIETDGTALLFEGKDGFALAFDSASATRFDNLTFGAREIFYVIDING